MCVGVGVLSMPKFGLASARGSLLTALLLDVVGTLIGALVGAFIGWTLRHNDARRR